jgi:hypothetical protein
MFWFHATKRSDEGGYLAIINDGCSPPPPHVDTETKQLELQLAISDAHVYCFLGRTLEQFGQFCIVLRTDGVPEGTICPFDSGGLVRKIRPVSTWDPDKQGEYLRSLSTSSTSLATRTARYPGTRIAPYLRCERPPEAGPHEIWAGLPEADIWRQGTHWRAWTWEGRWLKLPVNDTLHAWACTPALFKRIVEATERDKTIQPNVLDNFMRHYREGGVSAMIADLRMEQGG